MSGCGNALCLIYPGQQQPAGDKKQDHHGNPGPLGVKHLGQYPQKQRPHKGGEFSGKGKKTEKLIFLVFGHQPAQK